MNKIKEKPKKKYKPREKTLYKRTQMDMALLEYVRSGFSGWAAEKLTEVHHTAVQRAWEALSEAERDEYRERATTICESVEDRLTSEEITILAEYTAKLKDISNLALDELEERLRDPLRKTEIKDADLLNIAHKFISLVNENTSPKKEDKPQTINNMFNFFEDSIQENLNINSHNYENE
jgi:hypothetical protein